MTIKVGEIGKLLYVAAYFDMSNDSDIELEVKSPNGQSKILSGGVVGQEESPALSVGPQPAGTYAVYTVQDGDFDVKGSWQVRIIYTDSTPKRYLGDWATLTIGE